MSQIYDVFIIGGGVNGCGIARDAAGRGLSVYLCEKGDLARGTSSASSKMLHGGLRYLEYFEFGLVREALAEREVLLKAALHLIRPMQFILPHKNTLRPAWLIRLGLFLYDHIGGKTSLPKSSGVNLRKSPFGKILKKDIKKGFIYSDGWVDDARLVVLSAVDAQHKGASINSYTEFKSAKRIDNLWQVVIEKKDGSLETIQAKTLVNAAGPWLDGVVKLIEGLNTAGGRIRLVKGSHIITDKLYEGDHAYLLQNPDKRVIFLWSYEGKYTLIGTTDVELPDEGPKRPEISEEEIDYLCQSVNAYLEKQISKKDVLFSYSGVRPLFDDAQGNASAITRDYRIHVGKNSPHYLSIFGGKITTFRHLSEEVVDKICDILDLTLKPWTKKAILPGGDILDRQAFLEQKISQYSFLPQEVIKRLVNAYGTRIDAVLNKAQSVNDLGKNLGDNLYACEIDYLIDYEWARRSRDILRRRTKLDYHVSQKTKDTLEIYLKEKGYGGE